MTLSPFQVGRIASGWLASLTREAVQVLARRTQAGWPTSFKTMSFKKRLATVRARAAQMSAPQLKAAGYAMEDPAQVGWNDWKNQ